MKESLDWRFYLINYCEELGINKDVSSQAGPNNLVVLQVKTKGAFSQAEFNPCLRSLIYFIVLKWYLAKWAKVDRLKAAREMRILATDEIFKFKTYLA